MSTRRILLGSLTAVAMVGALSGCSTTADDRITLDEAAKASLDQLYRTVPAAKGVGADSAAILVFPSITKAALIFGGQYGDGVMFKDGKAIDYYSVAGGSWGLQAGAQTMSQAYFFTTPEALETFRKTKGWEVGAGLDVAVASTGASGEISTSTLQKPVVVFVYGQSGLMAGIQVQGQKITRLERK